MDLLAYCAVGFLFGGFTFEVSRKNVPPKDIMDLLPPMARHFLFCFVIVAALWPAFTVFTCGRMLAARTGGRTDE